MFLILRIASLSSTLPWTTEWLGRILLLLPPQPAGHPADSSQMSLMLDATSLPLFPSSRMLSSQDSLLSGCGWSAVAIQAKILVILVLASVYLRS